MRTSVSGPRPRGGPAGGSISSPRSAASTLGGSRPPRRSPESLRDDLRWTARPPPARGPVRSRRGRGSTRRRRTSPPAWQGGCGVAAAQGPASTACRDGHRQGAGDAAALCDEQLRSRQPAPLEELRARPAPRTTSLSRRRSTPPPRSGPQSTGEPGRPRRLAGEGQERCTKAAPMPAAATKPLGAKTPRPARAATTRSTHSASTATMSSAAATSWAPRGLRRGCPGEEAMEGKKRRRRRRSGTTRACASPAPSLGSAAGAAQHLQGRSSRGRARRRAAGGSASRWGCWPRSKPLRGPSRRH